MNECEKKYWKQVILIRKLELYIEAQREKIKELECKNVQN